MLHTVSRPSTQLTEGSNRSNGPARRKAERKAARNPQPPAQPTKRRAVDNDEQPRKRARDDKAAAAPERQPAGAEKQPDQKKEVKRKEKKELVLPEADGGHVEDREIEWLEYMLKKEKAKAKEEDSDGLDGELNAEHS